MGSDPNAPYVAEESNPANIAVELCSLFYDQGWMPGTAGGMSIKEGPSIYVTPSGVQKERMKPGDLIVYDVNTGSLTGSPLYKPSACLPLFRAIHNRTSAGSCIHTHSKNSALVTLLFDKEFQITQVENIKAIPKVVEPGNLGFYDTLKIPIIENRAHEEELEEALLETLDAHPETSAVLVRRHGVFVWGSTVWKAKIINEALDYLFDMAIEMHKLGLSSRITSP